MTIKNILSLILISSVITSCTEDNDWMTENLTSEQQDLIGKAVNFDASMAEDFTTRTSWNHSGAFNDGDLMVIYRQYWDKAENAWKEQAYRSYSFDVTYASGTTVSLGRNWKVAVGRMKGDWDSSLNEGKGGIGAPMSQTAADSLTWENGNTVRFRAWSRNNLADFINNSTAERYYPDYCIANWATVSGPTKGIPLTLRHVTCRIGFTCKAGNEFSKGAICLSKEDYQWDDNADTNGNDTSDKLSDTDAENVANAVTAVYNRMCMPAGVDIENGTLYAMTQSLYNNLETNKGFKTIEQRQIVSNPEGEGLVAYNSFTQDLITSKVKRPQFNLNDGRLYMFTIPYDMSTDAATQGEELVLPAHTRFKIWLRDVNNGDKGQTSGYEYKEHIFSLSDIKDGNSPRYPNGLTLSAGKSYLFNVGYQYDQLKVDIIEEGMNWSTGESGEGNATNAEKPTDNERWPYTWFNTAINTAIKESKVQGQDYNPVFHLSTAEDFVEFINLVNGSFKTDITDLKRVFRNAVNPDYNKELDTEYNDENDPSIHQGLSIEKKRKFEGCYWWYEESSVSGTDTTWLTRKEIAQKGYVIYNRYYPQLSTQAARSEVTVLSAPYSFYNEQLKLNFVIQMDTDIDLGDWKLNTIGQTADTPFNGHFDGGMHLLKNVYMKDEFLFGYMNNGEIRDIRIESTHNTTLLNEGNTSENDNFRIIGVSLAANSTKHPIAQKLTGRAYVIGCIQYGDAGGALVGEASDLVMMGCMRTASNDGAVGGALLKRYSAGASEFFRPLGEKSFSWSASTRFMCNYFIKHPTFNTRAVGFKNDGTTATAYSYLPQQYIRGAHDYVLKAKLDNLLSDDVPYSKLTTDLMREEFYGIAPWSAMNYAIAKFNTMQVATGHQYQSRLGLSHKCFAHYTVDDIGYKNLFPQLVSGAPTLDGQKDPMKQNN